MRTSAFYHHADLSLVDRHGSRIVNWTTTTWNACVPDDGTDDHETPKRLMMTWNCCFVDDPDGGGREKARNPDVVGYIRGARKTGGNGIDKPGTLSGCARWRKGWVKVLSKLAQDRRA